MKKSVFKKWPPPNTLQQAYRATILERITSAGVVTVTKTLHRGSESKGLVPCDVDDFFSTDTFDHFWVARELDTRSGRYDWVLAIRPKKGAIRSPMEVVPIYEAMSEKEQEDPTIVHVCTLSDSDMDGGSDPIVINFSQSIDAFKAKYPDAIGLLL